MDKELTAEQKSVLDSLKSYGSNTTFGLLTEEDLHIFDELEKMGYIKRTPGEGGNDGISYEIIQNKSK